MSETRAEFTNPSHKSLFDAEEAVLKFWQDQKIFQKSLDQTRDGEVFSFYDGPPFITGTPHYGTLLPSIAKDIIPRYQTMKGRFVRRRWGWDVHGLPAETQVEKRLGLKTKKDIEALGVDKFIEECRAYVAEVSDAWQWYIDHIGRWVEMDNAYRTDQLPYMESVIWAFKELYSKKLIYRGQRVSLYCPRCATPLSKFEVTMDDDSYRDVEDPAVTVAFRLLGDEVYLLAWTTTPWTLPANLALAVDPAAEYVKVTNGNQTFILAHQALERYRDFDLEIIETFPGSRLVGERYEPLYEFFPANEQSDYKVYGADFVTMEDGTGIVHVAPGFGEDDTKLGEANSLSLFLTLTDEGHFVPEVTPWAGQYYKKANPAITADLKERGLLFKEATIVHSYPHCYRCGTPLIYKAQVSWYLALEPLRAQLLAANNDINWVPSHFGSGRFNHNVENAPDWSLSRTRYWGTPIPVWETEDGDLFVPGSVAELEKASGQKIVDLHRPAIDRITVTTPSGKKATRVKEVLDCWFESGSMPYAQDHYPFGEKKDFERHFPADFIIEYTGQLRGWFYYLHVLAVALRGKPAFKNVAVTGVLMGTDGRKMSKSYGNYPDPRATIEKYGAEALRLYFMASRLMAGEETNINEEEIKVASRTLGVLHNSLQYFVTYANVHSWHPDSAKKAAPTILDTWITVRLEEFVGQYAVALDQFDFTASTRLIRPFIEDLSTWYIRRSRDRFVAGDAAALQTLHQVLQRFSVAVAPTLPFTAERIYRAVTQAQGSESVHLQPYPEADHGLVKHHGDLMRDMSLVREACSLGNTARAAAKLSTRQPVAEVRLQGFDTLQGNEDYAQIVASELNVLKVAFAPVEQHNGWVTAVGDSGQSVGLDTRLTPELEEEGRFRDLTRKLQEARKKAGLAVGQAVELRYHTSDPALAGLLTKRQADFAKTGSFSGLTAIDKSAGLEPIDGEELSVGFNDQ